MPNLSAALAPAHSARLSAAVLTRLRMPATALLGATLLLQGCGLGADGPTPSTSNQLPTPASTQASASTVEGTFGIDARQLSMVNGTGGLECSLNGLVKIGARTGWGYECEGPDKSRLKILALPASSPGGSTGGLVALVDMDLREVSQPARARAADTFIQVGAKSSSPGLKSFLATTANHLKRGEDRTAVIEGLPTVVRGTEANGGPRATGTTIPFGE
ncbi:hypothetical protein ACMYYO_03945 [Dermacoccaceae bacterium W4C1]